MIALRTRVKSLVAVTIAVSLTPLVWATTGVGTIVNVVLNRATADPLHTLAHSGNWNALLLTTGRTDVIIQNVQLAPGGYSGWHSHLGPVILTVKSGTATMYGGARPVPQTRVSGWKCIRRARRTTRAAERKCERRPRNV